MELATRKVTGILEVSIVLLYINASRGKDPYTLIEQSVY